MSRGLSWTQEKVMERIKDKGSLNVKDVAKIYHEIRIPKEKKLCIPMGVFWDDIGSIANINSIYRMMKTLEDKGLVGTLLHKRPKEWYYVEWKDDTIRLPYILNGGLPLLLVRNGYAKIKTEGRIITLYKQPSGTVTECH